MFHFDKLSVILLPGSLVELLKSHNNFLKVDAYGWLLPYNGKFLKGLIFEKSLYIVGMISKIFFENPVLATLSG